MTVGVLCIHGFTGAPYEVEPLAKFLSNETKWDIKMITLPGHGDGNTLKGVNHQQWIATAEEHLLSLLKSYHEVYIIGFSMGGMIASHLASKYPVRKLVLLSAAAYYTNPKQTLMDVKEMLQELMKRDLFANPLFMRYKQKFKDTPLKAVMEFRKLVHRLRPSLTRVQIPSLIIQGEKDGIVPVKSAKYIYKKVAAKEKEMHLLPNSQHHICYGEDKAELFALVHKFLVN